jgi:hypothetical protein
MKYDFIHKFAHLHICTWMLLLHFCLTGCEKSTDTTPALPSLSSLKMDALEDFVSKKKSGTSDDSSNFCSAYTFVYPWDTIAASYVDGPAVLFKEAINQDGISYDEESGEWTWTFIKEMSGDGEYYVTMTGEPSGDSVLWKMTVTRIGEVGFVNFVWLEGKSDVKNTGGWWMLYGSVSKAAALLIRWNYESESSNWLTYTNITDNDESGNSITYGTSSDCEYDRYFDISLVSSSSAVKIEWNNSDFCGKLTVNNGTALEWDESCTNK